MNLKKYFVNLIAVLAILLGLLVPMAPSAMAQETTPAAEDQGTVPHSPSAPDAVVVGIETEINNPYYPITTSVSLVSIPQGVLGKTYRAVIEHDQNYTLGDVLPGDLNPDTFGYLYDAPTRTITVTLGFHDGNIPTSNEELFQLVGGDEYIEGEQEVLEWVPVSLRILEEQQPLTDFSGGSLTLSRFLIQGSSTYWSGGPIVSSPITFTTPFEEKVVTTGSDGSYSTSIGSSSISQIEQTYTLDPSEVPNVITTLDILGLLFAGQTDTLVCPMAAGDVSGNNVLGEWDATIVSEFVADPNSYDRHIVFFPNHDSVVFTSSLFQRNTTGFFLGDCSGNAVLAPVGGNSVGTASTLSPSVISAGDTFTVTLPGTSAMGTAGLIYIDANAKFDYKLVLPEGHYSTIARPTVNREGFLVATTAPSAQIVATATGGNRTASFTAQLHAKLGEQPQEDMGIVSLYRLIDIFLPTLSR